MQQAFEKQAAELAPFILEDVVRSVLILCHNIVKILLPPVSEQCCEASVHSQPAT